MGGTTRKSTALALVSGLGLATTILFCLVLSAASVEATAGPGGSVSPQSVDVPTA